MKRFINKLKITSALLLLVSSNAFLAVPEVIDIAGKRLTVDEYLGPIFSRIYQDQIHMALVKTNLQERAFELKNVATNALADAQRNGLSSFSDDLQNTFAQAVTTVYEKQTPEALEEIRALLTDAQDSPLLTPEQQAYVRTDMLSRLPVAAQPATIASVTMDDITAATGAGTYSKKIEAFVVLIKKAASESYDATTQDAFGNALVNLFNARTGQQPAVLNKLSQLLKLAQTTPLLSVAQQDYVTTDMIPQLSKKNLPKKSVKAATETTRPARPTAATAPAKPMAPRAATLNKHDKMKPKMPVKKTRSSSRNSEVSTQS